MRYHWRPAALLLLTVSLVRGEAMLQYFNTSWREIRQKIPEVAEAGYESLWIPPPTKAGGGFSVGYDLFDRFDLGSKDQKGSMATRYGTEQELLDLIRVAHRFGIRVYFDSIMNHNGFDVPRYDEFVPEDVYPGFLPGDFHLRETGNGFYRKWDNTRDWGSEWQVQNLGLSGLIDIANEPGPANRNHGPFEGNTSGKPVFLRHPDNPEYYCYKPNAPGQTHAANEGTYVGFGGENGITRSFLQANESYYREVVEDMLHRSLRWQLDRTKADGARLDAVKHTPADFFGATFGADRDTSDYGYLGQAQRQFNLTRGYLDANHRDTVFSVDAPRDDAMFFGEHLGEPPSYGPYIDAGMRLIDNDLRRNLNDILGNPSATLSGYDRPGAGGFSPRVSVMHAQSHDNDFAVRRELQHAFYFTRDGLPLVYTDGNYHAGTLEGSGGAFPRHANTSFLGQFGDKRLPNLAYLHQHFGRGFQRPRWADNDFVAYERIDKRENGGMSDDAGVVAIVLVNDNYASGSSRSIRTTFPSTPFVDDAYLYQYARGYGSQTGFYKYASQLDEVVVDPGSYMVFSYRTPEESWAWGDIGGPPIEILQDGRRAASMTVTRRDGPDGDAGFSGPFANPGFHPRPSDLRGIGGDDFEYGVEIPRVTDASNLKFVFRADRSTANVLCKLDGGIDLNGTRPDGNTDPGFRDHPPALSTDVFLGYEQPDFVERMGPEKFAAKDTARCALVADEAESWTIRIGSGSFSRVNGGGNNVTPPDTAQFVYHDPEAPLPGSIATGNQYQERPNSIEIYAKTNSGLGGYRGALYYTLDRSVPLGAGGRGVKASTMAIPMNWVGDAEGGSWWKGTIAPRRAGTIRYVAAMRRATVNALFPGGSEEVSEKRHGMTVFEISGFNGEEVRFFPHNDYAKTPDQNSFVTETGLDEGFHILRARAFLERTGKASLFNTFQQTFYYDASRPRGEIVFPGENDTLSGQSYEVVVRADESVTEAWFHIEDGAGPNDDDQTGAGNGNGTGKWVRVSATSADPDLPSAFPREFRFNYANIPTGSIPSVINVRLREATSADPSSWTGAVGAADDARGWYTTLTRNVTANGPDRRLFVAFPATDGEVVGDDYVLKAYFSKSLGDGIPDQQLIEEFSVAIGSRFSGSPAGAVDQDKGLFRIFRDETVDYHALAFDVPVLWTGDPDFLHHVRVSHMRGGIELVATRLVRAAEVWEPFVNVVQPPAFDGGGQPWVEFIPDVANPTPGQREIPVRIETGGSVGHLTITFELGSGTLTFEEVLPVATQQAWDYRWTGVSPGLYRIRVDARVSPDGPILATTTRNITVALGPSVPPGQDNDSDSLPDWWEIAHGLSHADDGTRPGSAGNGPGGDPDGDGILNFTEFLVGLDPNQADRGAFPSLRIAANPDGGVRLTFSSIPDRHYTLSWSSDLVSWTVLGATVDTGADVLPAIYEILDTDRPRARSRFYRLEVALP
ncbi:MAG: alpha-amylase family glycosyl hydrolase [Roseibacillus sp.]|nr:alpha-amylase family glycosyl hydrolase [Roseibacillus sp.]